MSQFRVSLPDDVTAGMEVYSAVSRNEIISGCIKAIIPPHKSLQERADLFMAMIEGRIEINVTSREEVALRKQAVADADAARKANDKIRLRAKVAEVTAQLAKREQDAREEKVRAIAALNTNTKPEVNAGQGGDQTITADPVALHLTPEPEIKNPFNSISWTPTFTSRVDPRNMRSIRQNLNEAAIIPFRGVRHCFAVFNTPEVKGRREVWSLHDVIDCCDLKQEVALQKLVDAASETFMMPMACLNAWDDLESPGMKPRNVDNDYVDENDVSDHFTVKEGILWGTREAFEVIAPILSELLPEDQREEALKRIPMVGWSQEEIKKLMSENAKF